eukprot:TRINITY_DN6461_c0_g1_i1.p1 TRINITY_DN6461_c0_g1~~TRINITY_DN6461_c0_g1_i1.p1  ORF type:complete len:485 (+),score=154.35 TRINITY_DN6461_c0_g1_i1:88-1542(+)
MNNQQGMADWVEVTDPDNKRTYFHNQNDGTTTFDRPAVLQSNDTIDDFSYNQQPSAPTLNHQPVLNHQPSAPVIGSDSIEIDMGFQPYQSSRNIQQTNPNYSSYQSQPPPLPVRPVSDSQMMHQYQNSEVLPPVTTDSRHGRKQRKGPKRHPPVATFLLVLAVMGAFLFALEKSGWKLDEIYSNPSVGPNLEGMVDAGAMFPLTDEGSEMWRIASASLLTSGALHTALVCLGIIVIGLKVEEKCGFLCLITCSLPGALAAGLVSKAFVATYPTVCASGLVFSMYGAINGIALRKKKIYLEDENKKSKNHFWSFVLFLLLCGMAICFPYQNGFIIPIGFLTGLGMGIVWALLVSKSGSKGCCACMARMCRSLFALIIFAIVIAALVGAYWAVENDKTDVLKEECGDYCGVKTCIPTKWYDCVMGCDYVRVNDPDPRMKVTCWNDSVFYGNLEGESESARGRELCEEYCSFPDNAEDFEDSSSDGN